MKLLSEQIAEFEARGCVAGGRKWEIKYYHYPTKAEYDGYQIDLISESWLITVLKKPNERYELATIIKTERNIKLNSTTLEEALIEALEIVKAKVMDLAKELGFVCFDKEQAEDLQDGLGAGYRALELEYDIEIDENVALDKHISMQRIDELMGYIEEQLQQYIAEQGNDNN